MVLDLRSRAGRLHLVPCKCRAAAAAGSSGSGALPDADLATLSKMLSWPAAQLFPALDLARLLVLDRAAGGQLVAAAGPAAAQGVPGLLGAAVSAAYADPPVPAAQQTAVRLACNCFLHQPTLFWVQSAGSRLLDCFAQAAGSPSKNVRQGLATLLVNYAVWLCKLASAELEFKSRVSAGALRVGRCGACAANVGDGVCVACGACQAALSRAVGAEPTCALPRASLLSPCSCWCWL